MFSVFGTMPMATITWLKSLVVLAPALSLIVAVMPVSLTLIASTPAPVMIVMPCFLRLFSRKLETSASSTGTIRSSISTTVTSDPRSL